MSDKKCYFCGCEYNLDKCESCGNIICAPFVDGKDRECKCSNICDSCGKFTCTKCTRMDSNTFPHCLKCVRICCMCKADVYSNGVDFNKCPDACGVCHCFICPNCYVKCKLCGKIICRMCYRKYYMVKGLCKLCKLCAAYDSWMCDKCFDELKQHDNVVCEKCDTHGKNK